MNFKHFLALRIYAIFILTSAAASTNASSIYVYAASSMTNVVTTLGKEFYTQTGINVVPVVASSSSLARQILAGAPADIYISANTQWMDYLVQRHRVSRDNVTYIATNQLVVIAPVSKADHLELSDKSQWLSRLREGRLAIGDTHAVPAGIYAKQALQQLGLWQDLQPKLAPTSNVRVALTLVEHNEAPLGIVYRTDAWTSDKVKIVATFPSSSHAAITYPMVVLNDDISARIFAEFIQSKQGQSLLQGYGFL